LAGQEVVLLSTTADPVDSGSVESEWVKAPVASFGEDRVFEVTLSRRGVTTVVRATARHRWPIFDGRSIRMVQTDGLDSLRQPDRVPGMLYPPAGYLELSPDAVAQGVVWGDGSVYNRHG